MTEPSEGRVRVVVIGGGVAGLEAAMALRDLAPGAADVHVISPETEFPYKAVVVEEPFGAGAVRHYPIEPLLSAIGATFEVGLAKAFDLTARRIELTDGTSAGYDYAFVCVGGRRVPAYESVTAFADRADLAIDEILERRAAAADPVLTIVVPPGITWSLPAYELALLSRRRAEELGLAGIRLRLITPERSPLAVFGAVVGEAVRRLLNDRGIAFVAATEVIQPQAGSLHTMPGREQLDPESLIALARIEGPTLAGLPTDADGFIPVDSFGSVAGAERIYAAGDGTSVAIKQGGLGTQLADIAAQQLASQLVPGVEAPAPFRPVLRARLLTGAEPLNLSYEPDQLHGPGRASLDLMTWPPQKVDGRYLSHWLSEVERRADPDAPTHPFLDPRPGSAPADPGAAARTPEARRRAIRDLGGDR